LLTLHYLLTGTAVLVAIVALAKARRATKRLERLTETYWELRYDHGQLRARVAKLDPEAVPESEPARTGSGGSFVPLSSLKRS